MTDDELLKARDQAWIDWVDFTHQVYRPRFYKRRAGRGSVWINPFTSTDEMNEVKDHMEQLGAKYHEFRNECVKRGLYRLSMDLIFRWVEESTPDGMRYRRGNVTPRS